MATKIIGNLILSGSSETANPSHILAYDTGSNIISFAPAPPLLDSGTWTPIFTDEINGIAVTSTVATFIKVGNIVTVSAQLEITLDTGQDNGSFEMSLPVASNFTSTKNLFGLMQFSHLGTLAEIVFLDIQAEIANNTCFVGLQVATAGITYSYFTLQFQYEVI